jgi:hypothetical protein
MTKESHSNDGINKSDKSQQGSNVEQGWKRNDQSKQQFADSFGSFDKTKNSTDSENCKSVV